ncbi:MAG: cyclase family protein [Methylococcaceae bacterium]|nr:cyclase family protein [Methylococcaceae bacterium]MCI0668784.1 cyclase family protein [Methylococcaceae bacterium]MCI0734406.1 cyclase family protein [Methylococcaceae bacterium]
MKSKCAIAVYGFGYLLMVSFPTHALDFSTGKWVDLTHPFNEKTVYWPTARTFKKTTVFDGRTEGGWHYSAFDFEAAEHGGTHIDSPIHFAEGKLTTDRIPIERLVGPGIVIELKDKTIGNPDYQISVDDIRAFEQQNGAIPPGAIVLFDTGFARFYPDRKKYMGTDQRGSEALPKLHFPGLHPESARFLSSERGIDAIGLDTPSIDFGQSRDFMSHRILLDKNIPCFENLTNLDGLPPTGFLLIALPMKIEGGSGGPLRIVAFVPDD